MNSGSETRLSERGGELDLLRSLASIPTAAGRERRVVAFVERWVAARPHLVSRTDPHGNIEVMFKAAARSNDPIAARADRDLGAGPPPVYFTAHLDHPAFVVERVIGPGTFEVAFRGGVMDAYFDDAAVELFAEAGRPGGDVEVGRDWQEPSVVCAVVGRGDLEKPFKSWIVEARADGDPAGLAESIAPGDVGRWRLPQGEIREEDLSAFGGPGRGRVLHAQACDDLAAAAAMMAAMDRLADADPAGRLDTRLLFTRAEEIGFVGAIGASRDGLMPPGSRVIALENSRSFPHDSPIGGGPIVRVGDRLSTFTPSLTAAVSAIAESTFGRPALPRANQTEGDLAGKQPWQRKLMAGGACEASVFTAYGSDPARGLGWQSTCVCLPLGNYHNMADLAAVQAGTNASRPTLGREFISVDDWLGMVALLNACGRELREAGAGMLGKFEEIWGDRGFVVRAR